MPNSTNCINGTFDGNLCIWQTLTKDGIIQNDSFQQGMTNASHHLTSKEFVSCIPVNVLGIIFPILGILSILGHCLIMATIRRHEELHQPMYILVANNSISNVSGFLEGLFIVLYNRFGGRNQIVRMIQITMIRGSYLVSMITTCLLSINRFLTVYAPLKYPLMITKRKVLMLVAVVWLTCIGLFGATVQHGEVPFFDRPIHNYITIAVAWMTHLIEFPVVYYTQKVAHEKIAELKQTTSRLHGEKAEQLDTLEARQKKNKEVSYLLIVNQALHLPWHIGLTLLSASDVTAEGWMCCLTVYAFYLCITLAIHSVIFIRTLKDLRTFIVRDLKKS